MLVKREAVIAATKNHLVLCKAQQVLHLKKVKDYNAAFSQYKKEALAAEQRYVKELRYVKNWEEYWKHRHQFKWAKMPTKPYFQEREYYRDLNALLKFLNNLAEDTIETDALAQNRQHRYWYNVVRTVTAGTQG